MTVVPCTITRAREIIRLHHRHNRPPVGGLFALAAELDGELVGVAMVGRPVARMLQDRFTAEVTRTCTLPSAPKGAVSFLYAACRRVAFALGYRKLITYTLASESGASLRGAGWQMEAELKPRAGWDTPSRRRAAGTVDNTAKRRWAASVPETPQKPSLSEMKGGRHEQESHDSRGVQDSLGI
jgi:hypothetical protein